MTSIDPTTWKFGYLLGRVLAAWLMVWVVCLLLARGNWRAALRRSIHPWSIAAVIGLLAIGFLGTALRLGGHST